MEEKEISWQGKKIFYRTAGRGEPVLLLHGFGEDGNIWQKQAEVLKEKYFLIIPDIPGSGKSELIEGANIETYAEIIKEILDTESSQFSRHGGTEGVCIIGHSMGGYITLAFAEKYPQYLKSFGLFHSSAFSDSDEKKQTRAKAIEFIKENGAYTFLKTSTPGLFTEAFNKTNTNAVNELIETGKNFTEAALIQYYRAMIERPDRTEVLHNVSKPVLFIMGEYDNAVPLQSSLKQCYLPIVSHVHILRSSAHMGMWEEADTANEILSGFLSFY
jgi:pimeloyl-ACP methyl ester carboxylesterase